MICQSISRCAVVLSACFISAYSISAAPALSTTTWTQLSTESAVGISVDASNPLTIYVGTNSPNKGMNKTTNGGSTWANVGKIDGTTSFGNDVFPRVDPRNSNNLYGYTGVANMYGFWASTDGGINWTEPAGFDSVSKIINDKDMYCIAVDPTDFNHFLLSYHYYWYNGMAGGIVESFDGGKTCIIHDPIPGVSGNGGYYVFFLYDPRSGQGDSHTWLFMTQPGGTGSGWWRTTNSGTSWTQASTYPMTHGGSNIYYTKDGTLFASGETQIMRSTNNGVSWTPITNGLPYTYFLTVIGDGNTLYTGPGLTGGEFYTSSETDGLTWKKFNSQTFSHGPGRMAFDSANGIMYASCGTAGLWALKTPTASTSVSKTNQIARSSSHSGRSIQLAGNHSVLPIGISNQVGKLGCFDIKGRPIGINRIVAGQAIILKEER
jgi:hypothetical protein